MGKVKQYGQFCALARSLDVVGDRWTLLVVRELLLGPATYGSLLKRLPGIATNLLADRLRELQEAGLVEIGRERRDPYALTLRGQELRPVVRELIRWGGPLMKPGPGEDVVHEHWLPLALEAVLDARAVTRPKARVRLVCGEAAADVCVSRAGRRVEAVAPGQEADAQVIGSLPQLLAAAHAGSVEGLHVVGDRDVVAAVLRPA